MNRVTRGTVVLAAAVVAMVSCKGDPTGDLRNGIDHLIAKPGAIFIGPDSTKSVLVEAVDKQGNRLATTFSLGNVGAGISVVPDDSFNLVYNTSGQLVPPKNWTRIQYKVTGVVNDASSSFVVTAAGKSITIPVRVVPDSGIITVSATTPTLGDTVTATAGANFRFTPSSVVSVSGATVITLGISADSSQITFIPGPSANGPVHVSGMVVSYAPAISGLTGSSGLAIMTTPPVANLAAVLSTTTPNVNDNVTVTAPAGIKFLPNAQVLFGSDQQVVLSVAADSNSLVFRAHQAGASGTITLNNIVLSFLTSVPIASNITSTATVGATITSLAGTDAFATAPVIVIPDAGNTGGIVDAGAFAVGPAVCNATLGGPCRIYTFTVTSSRTFAVSASWQGTTDIGVYFTTAAGSLTNTSGCDAKGAGAGGQPETCSGTFAAGTYFLVVDSFAPFYGPPNNVDPTNINVTITGQ
jgi:hypothetical protein